MRINIILLLIILITIPTLYHSKESKSNKSWEYEDLGKMWTFDNIPLDYFNSKYGFNPTQEWLNDVQKSALQFGNGCSGAFISEDGLIMTNHHCARGRLKDIQVEGENLLKDGFYAHKIEEERKVEDLFVDQLISINDVTSDVSSYMNKGITDKDKILLRDVIIDSLETKFSKETGLVCKVIILYYGGKYSLYSYRRYDDIRLVMSPDFQIAATGWDWDNFTYPRYELDFMFFRAYDNNGKPVKVNNYFKWSTNGAKEGDPIFVVGRPGSTNRLYSIEQLNYIRDYAYPKYLVGLNSLYNAYFLLYEKYPDKESLLHNVMKWGNARKSYTGRLVGLNNNVIMKRKSKFQNELKSKIQMSKELNIKYGDLWDSINEVIKSLEFHSVDNTILKIGYYIEPIYYKLAKEIIKIAKNNSLPNDEKEEKYIDENLSKTIEEIFPQNIDFEFEDKILDASINFITQITDSNHSLIKNIFGNHLEKFNANQLRKQSKILSKEEFIKLSNLDYDEITSINDPFVKYILITDKMQKNTKKIVKELNNQLAVLNQLLGEAVYSIYGDKIPPDATSTLRISDGIIKGYEYNGTMAPSKTTFYGLWDRYESFNKKTYPWGLHPRWKIPPKELDLSIPLCFVSTNDIVGGNSGSSAININREIIGLVHDGNYESLAGHTIFLEENNRTVATDSKGLIEALKHVYKADRLVKELQNSKID